MSGSAFRRSVDVFVDSKLSPQAQSKALATVAREGVRDLVQSRRASPLYSRYVDGVEGASEDAVKPGGVIIYRFQYLAEILVFVLEFARKRSPQGGGQPWGRTIYTQAFRDSFFFGLDGRFVLARNFNPRTMGDVSEVVFGNIAPWNRKVDVQLVGRKPLNFSVPEGLYDDTVAAVRSRFGNMVAAKRVYTMQFPGRYRLQQTQMRGGARSHSVKRWAGAFVESPAIIIRPR